METPKQLFDTRVNVFLGDTPHRPPGLRDEPPIRPPRMVPSPRPPKIGADHVGSFRPRWVELKPFADGTRNIFPFGLPKREGHPERTRRSTGGVARSQLYPSRGGTGALVHRRGRLGDRSPRPLPSDRQPRLREGRLNGFPGALAEVLLHRVGGGGRRAPDAASTGVFGAAKAGKYPSHKRTPVFRGATCLAAPLCDASASAPVLARFDHP